MASRVVVKSGACARIALRCWGNFAVDDADSGADLKPRGRKARALLAYLAMHPGKAVSREKLMGLLWSERADEQARASLRQSLFELRGFACDPDGLLAVDRDTVTLRPESLVSDIDALAAAAASGDYDGLLDSLPEADDTLFANLDGIDRAFDEWLRIERTRRRDALLTLVGDASASALAEGKVRAARALHARLLEYDPEERRAAPPPPPVVDVPHDRGAIAVDRPAGRAPFAALLAVGLAGAATIGVWLGTPVSPAEAGPSREVQGLYGTAQEIVYQRKSGDYPTAIELLRRAVALDPEFAPGWSNLAAVTAMSDQSPEGLAEAEHLARRAIRLDPGLGHAHGVLGMVLGFRSAEARTAIKQAATLDPDNPEIQFWLSNVLAIEGDYGGRLNALRRAAAIDPLWHRASGMAALAAFEMGHSDEADTYAERLRRTSLRLSFLCAYGVDWARGDYSDVVRDTLAMRPRLQSSDAADRKLGNALLVLGHDRSARLLLRLPPELWQVASGGPPSPAAFKDIERRSASEERADFYFAAALAQMLNAGRAAEIVALYDARTDRLGELARPDAPITALMNDGIQVALALRAVGRVAEANALLARADGAIRRVLAQGQAPNWFYAATAQVRAAQGRKDEAIAALAAAIDRRWLYAPMTMRPDVADIPAFRDLRGDPRFERQRTRLLDHIERERRELGAVPV